MSFLQDSEARKKAWLLRTLREAQKSALHAIVNYSYNGVLLAPHLPFAGKLFEGLLAQECEQLWALGVLLCDLGVSPVLDTRVQSRAYTLKQDADSHAPVVARRMIDDLLPEAEQAQSLFRTLAMHTGNPNARRRLLELAVQKEHQRDALLCAKNKLTCS